MAAEETTYRRGIPDWVKVLIVVAFALVAFAVTWHYLKKYGRDQNVEWVNQDISEARRLAQQDRISEALSSLDRARMTAEKFDQNDPTRADLVSKIKGERGHLRQLVRDKLQALVSEGKLDEAERLYASGVAEIDIGDELLNIVKKGQNDRRLMREFRQTLSDAQAAHDGDRMEDGLKFITNLRKRVESREAHDIEGIDVMRREVAKLQDAWVQEALAVGYKHLDEGRLSEARQWFETANEYVWERNETLKQDLKDVIYRLKERRIAGVAVKMGAVRAVKPEDVKKVLLDELKRKLAREDFLMLTLVSANDPRALELMRIIVVDYREEAAHELKGPSGQKARGTRILCDVELRSVAQGVKLWEQKIDVKTGTVGIVAGEFNETTLRRDAERTFLSSFTAIRLPRLTLGGGR